MSESDSYPKAEFFRKLNLSKNSPNVPKCGLNRRHDNREVTWRDRYSVFPQDEFVSEYLPNVPKCGLNTRHDNREVTLIHLTRAQTWRSDKCATVQSRKRVNDYQRYSMLPSMLHHRQIFVLSGKRRSFSTGIQFVRRIFWKIVGVSDVDKCYG